MAGSFASAARSRAETPTFSREFAVAVCEWLGIDPEGTASITIRIVGQEIPVVEIEQIHRAEIGGFVKMLRRHQLMLVDDEKA